MGPGKRSPSGELSRAGTEPLCGFDFLGPSARKSDLRVHFEPLKRPADDEALAARLWTLSEEATGMHYLDAAPATH